MSKVVLKFLNDLTLTVMATTQISKSTSYLRVTSRNFRVTLPYLKEFFALNCALFPSQYYLLFLLTGFNSNNLDIRASSNLKSMLW